MEADIEQFIDYLAKVRNSSPHTLRNYQSDLKLFYHYLQSAGFTPSIKSIDKTIIRQFLTHLTLGHIAKKSLLRRLAALRSFFNYLKAEKKIETSPLAEIETPKADKPLPPAVSYAEVERLMAQPDVTDYLGLRDRTMMELLYSSGLRVSELVALNKQDLSLKALSVKLSGKGRKERLIPITQNAANWLEKYLHHTDRMEQDPQAVFLNKWGGRLTARSVDRQFHIYLKTSGLSARITPHVIRHTIATHWLEKGMDLKTIQLLLGHNHLNTTTIYTRVSTGLQQEVYKKTHPRARSKTASGIKHSLLE